MAQRPRENGYFPITPPEIPSGRYFAEVDEVKEPLGEPSLTQVGGAVGRTPPSLELMMTVCVCARAVKTRI